MKRLSLANKVLLLFASQAGVLLLIVVTTYLGFSLLEEENEKLLQLKELQIHISELNQFKPEQTGVDQERFRTLISKTRALTQQITLTQKDLDPDLFRRMKAIITGMGYYQDAWLELHDKYATDRELARSRIDLSSRILSTLPPDAAQVLRFNLNRLRGLSARIMFTRDVSLIGEMQKARKAITMLTPRPEVIQIMEQTIHNAEESYINYLSIKERENFLQKTTDHFSQISRDTISTIQQSGRNERARLFWTFMSLLLLSILIGAFSWLRITRYLQRFLNSQSQAIKAISQGNYDYPLPNLPKDELGELSQFLKKMAISVKESKAFLSDTLNELPFFVFVLDIEGNILFANKQALQTAGQDLQKVKGTKLQHAYWVAHNIGEQHAMKERIHRCAKGEKLSCQMQWRIAGGTLIWVDFTLHPVFGEDTWVKYLIPSAIDITKRKQNDMEIQRYREHLEELVEIRTRDLHHAMEEAKISRDAANEAAQAKSVFLANMSHEIRTPMNAIIGMSHLALQTNLNTKQRNYIEKVHISAESLLGIINDILDFSKIESGKLVMEETDFHLEDILQHLINLIGFKAEEKNIIFKIDVAPKVPTALSGDSLRLGQILINLCNNSVKFTDPGGEIQVTVGVKEIHENATLLQFMVRDNGIGIAPEQQARLFQSFTQADSSTTRKYGGSGLGLVIAKTLTEMMGGEIHVESELGVGSTFFFTVRLKRQMRKRTLRHTEITATASQTDEAIAALRDAKILLVEDNPINQELALELLQDYGIRVQVADNGLEALNMLQQEHFDGVLMDCQMPVMDGYTATRIIRTMAEFKDLPIIAMTANVMKGDLERELQAGMNDHITKPIDVDEMFKTMAKWITTHQTPNTENKDLPRHMTTQTTSHLPDLPGIDTKAGLMVVQGKLPLYCKLLNMFYKSQGNFEHQFRTALANKQDPQAATRTAHSLKGVAGNIGAQDVQKAAHALEMACGNDTEDLERLLNAVLEKLQPVIAGLERFTSSTTCGDASSSHVA